MKDLIINSSLRFIKDNNPEINSERLAEIKYGLISIYLLITKFIVILFLAWILGIIKELLIFTILYNIIRIPSFGLHATKSWICLMISTLMFLGIPLFCLNVTIPIQIKIVIGIIFTLFIMKNSPADTHKRPIINPKRRKFFKITSTIISMVFVFIAIIIKDNFISNCLIAAIGCQTLFISPTIYKLFKLPYNNYKNYTLDNN